MIVHYLNFPHRTPPHHLRHRHRLTIRRVHSVPRHPNHNSLLPCPIKPILHTRLNLR
ncbi:hypothetical protein [Nostoc sp. FACHB-145]|uniref:hypothetical protein n=1 Tax=Nostoc sp. FACHB-145 TaxID=2692836 RepID=UPI001686ED73|nr:hypothetical protein [Nostoc sp. FACHB-145]MBD2468820.1 hypothetical protein [Nostoc sp. FACHB-145]